MSKTGSASYRGEGRRWINLFVFALFVSGAFSGQVLDDQQIKAAFLYNFAKFVEWPAEALNSPNDPVVCCILGESPFTDALSRAASGRPIEAHTFLIRKISEPRQTAGCHLLFVSSAERRSVRAMLKDVPSNGILTVGETENFIAEGGLANFKLEKGKLRIQINIKAAERARLRISPKLLSIAEIVEK